MVLKRWFRRLRLRQSLPVLLALALLASAALTVVLVPVREAQPLADAKERIAAVNDGRRTWAQIFGGLFLVAGLWLTWENVVIAREGKITDRFSKAVDQLAHDKLAVRLGGIYALERIALDSPRDHWTIVEVLTAYVRERARWVAPEDHRSAVQLINSRQQEDWALIGPDVEPDVQAVLTVLGRRKWQYDQGTVDLAHVNLRNVRLTGAHLAGVDFSGSNLEGAMLDKAVLEGITARYAWLDGAFLNETDLRRADLRGAHLREAEVNDARLEKVGLRSADLTDSEFKRSNLDQTDFGGARIFGIRLEGASLRGADFTHVQSHWPEHFAQQIPKAIIDGKTKLPVAPTVQPLTPTADGPQDG